ncbi:hypothetical protein [Streptomyces sp. NPDC056527]|uniref:hypothetical protein n=1 Tax=Streptomyces sp. NPDC056527 TaxID=3345853 RepID=UPI0036CF19B0
MDVIRSYFEENPDLFAALVALVAVVGGLAGSVIGAKIQANGGRAQATAAREAAQISSEAQRVAALWTVRHVQTAEFIQQARQVVRAADRAYTTDDEGSVREALQVLTQKQAQVELIASRCVIDGAANVVRSVEDFARLALKRGPAAYAEFVLQRIMTSGSCTVEVVEAARLLTELKGVYRNYGVQEISEEGLQGLDRDALNSVLRAQRDASAALGAVPGIRRHHVDAVLEHAGNRELPLDYQELEGLYEASMAALVTTARTMLKSEDGFAAS